MSEDRRPGVPGPSGPEDDDVVVPHPFGSAARGERPAADPVVEPEEKPEDEPGGAEATRAEPTQDEPTQDEPTQDEPTPDGPTDAAPVGAAERPAAAADEPSGPGEEPEARQAPPSPGRRRRPDPLAAALIGVLTLLLGFAFAVQVRSADDTQQLAGAREEDLVRILDELSAREDRLRAQLADQRSALSQLTDSDSQSEAALEEARQRAEAIGILNGTVAAEGPGLEMEIRDPEDAVRVADVLDAIQELRGAGAETMQIDGVRIGVSSAVTGQPGGLMIDGRPITAPYEFVVIGDPQGMETAMNIPGGVVQDMTRLGGSVTIQQSDAVVVDALRPPDTPQYASPTTDD
jgi:uncharacterized protein YlxW (UPF0749 family)